MSDMRKQPERIWCVKDGATNAGGHTVDFFSQRGDIWGSHPDATEYVRADLCDPIQNSKVRDTLLKAYHLCHPMNGSNELDDIASEILTLIERCKP